MSGSDKHINDQIRKSFESAPNKKAPDLWSSIEDSFGAKSIGETIAESFEKQEKVAPQNSWDLIRRGVIIDEVWTNIAAAQDKRRRGIVWFSLTGVFILLIGISGWIAWSHKSVSASNFVLKNNSQTPYEQSTVLKQTQEQITNKETTINNIVKSTFPESLVENKTDSAFANNQNHSTGKNGSDDANTELESHQNASALWENNSSIYPQINDEEPLTLYQIKKLPTLDIALLPAYYPKLDLNELNSPDLEINPKGDNKNSSFEMGITTGINNTWILNNDVKFGFKRESLIRNSFSGGYNVGISAIYNLNQRNSLVFNYDFLSKLSQRYYEYIHGQLYSNSIELNQQKFSLSYKHNFKLIPSDNQYLVLRSGVFGAYSNKTMLSNTLTENNFDLENYDFGLKLGAGFEHDLNNLVLEYGIQSDIGVLNITKENTNVLKKFEKTNTLIIGLYVSLRYKL